MSRARKPHQLKVAVRDLYKGCTVMFDTVVFTLSHQIRSPGFTANVRIYMLCFLAATVMSRYAML